MAVQTEFKCESGKALETLVAFALENERRITGDAPLARQIRGEWPAADYVFISNDVRVVPQVYISEEGELPVFLTGIKISGPAAPSLLTALSCIPLDLKICSEERKVDPESLAGLGVNITEKEIAERVTTEEELERKCKIQREEAEQKYGLLEERAYEAVLSFRPEEGLISGWQSHRAIAQALESAGCPALGSEAMNKIYSCLLELKRFESVSQSGEEGPRKRFDELRKSLPDKLKGVIGNALYEIYCAGLPNYRAKKSIRVDSPHLQFWVDLSMKDGKGVLVLPDELRVFASDLAAFTEAEKTLLDHVKSIDCWPGRPYLNGRDKGTDSGSTVRSNIDFAGGKPYELTIESHRKPVPKQMIAAFANFLHAAHPQATTFKLVEINDTNLAFPGIERYLAERAQTSGSWASYRRGVGGS